MDCERVCILGTVCPEPGGEDSPKTLGSGDALGAVSVD